MKNVLNIYNNIGGKLNNYSYLAVILVRFVLGWVFLWAGWGKLNNLESVIGYFTSLGIPMASVQAPFIAGLEFVGGICLIIGLGTRGFSLLLMSTMAVALVTAIIPELDSFSQVWGKSETIYLVVFLWLAFSGAGKVSVDNVLKIK